VRGVRVPEPRGNQERGLRVPGGRQVGALLAWQLALTAVLAGSALSKFVPLTYDEAWNYINLAARGPLHVLRNYEYPNNHVLFTLAQTLLPTSAIAKNPHALRLLNVLVAGVLLGIVAILAWRETHGRFAAAWVALALAFCSPLFTLYLFLARGYLLGTSLLLLALLCAAAARPFAAGVLLGLAIATVPTFAFAGPGMLAGFWFGRNPVAARVRQMAISAAPALALALVTYGRHLDRINAHRRAAWTAGVTLEGFCRETLGSMGNALPASIAVAALLAVAAWPVGPPRCAEPRSARLPVFLLLAVTSFYAVVAVCALTRISNLPFPRNAMFVPLFAWLAAFLLAQRGGPWLRRICLVALLANGLWGGNLFARTFLSRHAATYAYPYYGELSPTASERLPELARQMNVTGVQAEWAAEPVASLYSAALRVPLRRADGMVERPCDLGDGPWEKGRRVWVEVSGSARPLLLCR
jgi:hypothetical protein